MLLFYHLITSLFLFVEDGLSRSLDSSEPTGNPVRMGLSEEGVFFVGDHLDPQTKRGRNPSSDNLQLMRDIKDEKVLKEIFIACAEQNNTIPFLKKKMFDKDTDCYRIGEQGPCLGEDEWLVVSDESDDVSFPWSICKRNPCHEYENTIPYNDDCLKDGSLRCGQGEVLETNIHGQGVCVCHASLIRHKNKCYQEFLQGPCNEGEQFLKDPETQDLSCAKTNCPFKNQIRWSNGECLDSIDCRSDFVSLKNGTLDCGVSLRQLISVPDFCREGEAKDASGHCQKLLNNLGRSSRSSGGRINFNGQTLKRLMCSKHPNRFNC